MTRCVLVSGEGPYADPWHPFERTGDELESLLAPAFDTVDRPHGVEAALETLPADTTLLVLNVGNAGPGTPGAAARDGLLRHLAAGGALLAVHSTSTAFPDWPDWEAVLGGRWVRGTTFHPTQGPGLVTLDDPTLIHGASTFDTVDEFYTDLRVSPTVTVVAHHEHGGVAQPVAWLHRTSAARVGYVSLGHDEVAYSDGTRALILGCVRRLLGGRAGHASEPSQSGSQGLRSTPPARRSPSGR